MEEFVFKPVVKVEPVKVKVWECQCARCKKPMDFHGKLDFYDNIVLTVSPCDCVKNSV